MRCSSELFSYEINVPLCIVGKKTMKILFVIVAALLLSSCALQSPKEVVPISQRVQFSGAQNALTPDLRQSLEIFTDLPIGDGSTRLIQFPLTYAIECLNKSDCKHAVVKTHLEFTTQGVGEGLVRFTGVLHSEMGRSISVTSPSLSGYSQTQSMTIPNNVRVIGESKNDQPFERVLRFGEKLELQGLAGVHINVEFN